MQDTFRGRTPRSRILRRKTLHDCTGQGVSRQGVVEAREISDSHLLGARLELAEDSASEHHHSEAIIAANECPAGRLTAVEKDGTVHEPVYEPGIEILQDPEEHVSCGIFVKGGVPIESADGSRYEVRNRVVLCRCGYSGNKPFCDSRHVSEGYRDDEV